MRQKRLGDIAEVLNTMAIECQTETADPDEIIIRYTGKLAVLREQWKTEDRLKARQA